MNCYNINNDLLKQNKSEKTNKKMQCRDSHISAKCCESQINVRFIFGFKNNNGFIIRVIKNTLQFLNSLPTCFYVIFFFQGSPTKDISTEESPKKDKKKKKGLRTPSFLKKKKEKKKIAEA